MTIDSRLLGIEAPDASHDADLRSAMEAIDDALANGWTATEGGGVTTRSGERVILLPPFSQWIGGTDSPPLGGDLLRLVRDLCARVLSRDLRHPHEEAFRCSPHELAEAMLLVTADRVPAHARKPTLFCELANPFAPPRIQWRRAGTGSPRSHRVCDGGETTRWATLAPPSVGLFVTRNSIDEGRLVDHVTIGLVMRQLASSLDRLRGRPMDALRATALLASVGEPT